MEDDYTNKYVKDYYYSPEDSNYLETLEYEKFENKQQNEDELYVWRSFVWDLKERKIKIKKKLGWFYKSTKKEDISYTFDLYKEKFKKSSPTDTHKEDYFLSTMTKKYNNIFEGIYDNFFYYDDSFFLFSWDEKMMESLETTKLTNEEFNKLIDLIKEKKIKVLNKPKSWFSRENPTLKENLEYTIKKYSLILSQLKTNPLYYKNIDNFKERTNVSESTINSKKLFIQRNPELIDIYKKFMVENDNQLNKLLRNLTLVQNLPENEIQDILIQEARKKYNFEKEKNDEDIRNFGSLLFNEKQQVREKSKYLEKFHKKIKPFVDYYDARNKARDESLQKEARKKEEALKRKKMNEEIEDLEYKISDAQSKYSINKAKLRKLDGKLKKLKLLEKRKLELQEKLRLKNLSIQERQNILKEKTELNEKLANIEKLQDKVSDLKSNIPDLSVFEQEKILRERELQKLKNLNDASIREKNALLKSIELEKIKREIRIREEERYRQEQREKEELKQAKIIFLKEKKITERKLNELKISTKMKNDRIAKIKENEKRENLLKDSLKFLVEGHKTEINEKKIEIDKKKLKLLEIEKQELEKKQDYADQQKLFTDSIQRDIDDLNAQKNILKQITLENEKILKNTKDELQKRQTEIEKTLKLNLANAKQREADILSEESKIKLDVFFTLEDVKDQTSKKLDLEKKLQDLKDEIIRKQDVSDLLNETVEKISNTEISEAEEYNSFLESEISFKKKLSDINLNQKQVLETLMEEKQSYLNLLKDTKSTFIQDLLNTKREIVEKNIKITLVEGKENLSYVLSQMKYDLENLEKEKEILQKRLIFTKFQYDNYKRELNLRNQEIELLKNIRLKVLQKERLDLRNQANQEIIDTVKKIEAKEKQDVREKLDEIIDDVENVEISRKSKAALFSVLDKIEDKENKQIVKEKVNFILGKIELHENIEDARKNLDEFFKDKQIKKDVSEKLDEILDDVELDDDDYDYLDEEDNFDKFLSSVKKHISGEKKMEQFSRIDVILEDTRKEDSKLKMDENIEMKKIGPEDYEQGEGSQETSFDEFSDYNFFINRIEDPILKEKTRTFLSNLDGFEKEEEKIPKIKNAYKSAINDALWNDQLDLNYWDGNIIQDERAKFDYEQKVNNINNALTGDYDIHLDPTDLKIREFLDIKLTNSFSEKRGEINGYIYEGEKIINRNIRRFFYFEKVKKIQKTEKFIAELKSIINNTARSQIANESYFEGEKAIKDCALEYIGELREEQSNQIDFAKNAKEMRDALRNANDIDKEIKDIKKNSSFKMRLKIFKRTLSYKFTKLLRKLWKHKKVAGGLLASLIFASIGILLNQLGVIGIVHHLKNASKAVRQYANDVHEMGKRIILSIQSLYRIPGNFIGYSLMVFGFFLQGLYFLSYFTRGFSSGIIFEALGLVVEISIYFDTNFEKINNSTANIVQESGKKIQKISERAQDYLEKNSPPFVWGKIPENKTVLQAIESGVIKVIHGIAKGTEDVGKVIEKTGDTMHTSYYYLKILMYVILTLIILIIFRDLSNLTIIKNGNETKKSTVKRRKKT